MTTQPALAAPADATTDAPDLIFDKQLSGKAGSLVLATERFWSLLDRDSRNLLMRLRRLDSGRFSATFEEERQPRETENGQRDPLTGIASRTCFETAVERALQRNPEARLSVMLIDLDRFKAVNDTLGHAAGDSLLKLAAGRLQSAVRGTDLVARFGGDEFAVLLDPSPNQEEPSRIGRRILDLAQRTYMIEGQLVNVGASVGIAQSPENGNGLQNAAAERGPGVVSLESAGPGYVSIFRPQHGETRSGPPHKRTGIAKSAGASTAGTLLPAAGGYPERNAWWALRH